MYNPAQNIKKQIIEKYLNIRDPGFFKNGQISSRDQRSLFEQYYFVASELLCTLKIKTL